MEDLRQTLRDAGCDGRQEALIAGLWESGRMQDAGRILRLHRRDLMEQLHTAQSRVDCLDWLLRQMERKRNDSRRDTGGKGR